ncbi:hypothetical protein EV426DRAFT_715300 [Tirmania nivea]|nr:hypothetical protein EV426DRAFT_715300 [Tirmania nivea]
MGNNSSVGTISKAILPPPGHNVQLSTVRKIATSVDNFIPPAKVSAQLFRPVLPQPTFALSEGGAPVDVAPPEGQVRIGDSLVTQAQPPATIAMYHVEPKHNLTTLGSYTIHLKSRLKCFINTLTSTIFRNIRRFVEKV